MISKRIQSWNSINRILYQLNQSRFFIKIKDLLKILDYEINDIRIRMNKYLHLILNLKLQFDIQNIKRKSNYIIPLLNSLITIFIIEK